MLNVRPGRTRARLILVNLGRETLHDARKIP